MSNILKKTLDSLRNNGLRFTLSMIRYRFRGGADPRMDPTYLQNYQKRTESSRITEGLEAYLNDVSDMPLETIYSLHKTILPIDCCLETTASCKRINLVLEQFDDVTFFTDLIGAYAVAAQLAQKNNAELRIISRATPVNAKIFVSKMSALGVKLPYNITYYNDMDKTVSGDNQYKLPIGYGDIFIATSWKTALAAEKTTISPKYFYYLTGQDLSLDSPKSEKYFAALSNDVTLIVDSQESWNYLSIHHPHILKDAICVEQDDHANILTFMEKQVKWN